MSLPGFAFVVAGFLIGSIPFGVLVARLFFKTDIRTAGSGNIGAANALRTLGRKAGIAVLVLDALKGVIATSLPNWFASQLGGDTPRETVMAAAALAAIAGHCWSPFLRFRGGKGVATFLGVLMVAAWPSALAFAAVWLAIVLPTGYASFASLAASLTACAILAALCGIWTLCFSLPAFAIIVWKHKENLGRLYTGHESRLELLHR